MKKSSKIVLSLCLSPLLLLTACVPPPSYIITASSSDIQLGYVKDFKKEAMEEGSKVTLSAISTSDSDFLCWIKDDKTVVSSEDKFNLTYSKKSAGHYTAVFEESDLSKMMYASLTEMTFVPNGYTKVDYQISTAMLTSGSSDYYDFTSGNYSIGQEHSINPESVIYFGGAGDQYIYLIKIAFKLYTTSNTETSFEYSLTTKIDKSLFEDQKEITITEEVSAVESSLNLKFTKLNSEMFVKTETNSPEI